MARTIFDDPYDSSLTLADRPGGRLPLVQAEGLGKHFHEAGTAVFGDAWFSVARGETLCLVGRPGCGKTTLLRLLAGLETASDGAVIVDGRAPVGPGADRALVAAEHGLLRWMTLVDNIAFAVRGRWPGWTTTKVMAHSRHYAALFGLSRVEGKKPGQVSAAVKLRVALARAFAAEPKLMLLDDPFAALDAPVRGALLDAVRHHSLEARQTVVMAAHDIDEVLFLADRILLMNDGPDARIVESVVSTLPRERARLELHRHPQYYALRDHLIAFLTERSQLRSGGFKPSRDAQLPPEVVPGAQAAVPAAAAPEPSQPAVLVAGRPASAREAGEAA